MSSSAYSVTVTILAYGIGFLAEFYERFGSKRGIKLPYSKYVYYLILSMLFCLFSENGVCFSWFSLEQPSLAYLATVVSGILSSFCGLLWLVFRGILLGLRYESKRLKKEAEYVVKVQRYESFVSRYRLWIYFIIACVILVAALPEIKSVLRIFELANH